MNFIKILNIFKKTKFWFIVLKYLVAPGYNFIWEYLINLKGKLLYKKFKKKKSIQFIKSMMIYLV